MEKLVKSLLLVILVMGLLSCGKQVRKTNTRESVENNEYEYYDRYDRELMKDAKYIIISP